MANLKKVSEFTIISSSSVQGNDIFYFVHRVGGSTASYALQFSDLFVATNNLTTDIKFYNNTLYITNGKVGVNKTNPLADLDINGDIIAEDVTFDTIDSDEADIDTIEAGVITSKSTPQATYQELINILYPVGHIYMSIVSTNPNTLFGVGTWVAWGEGRVPVSKASSGTFQTVESVGGNENVTLTANQSGLREHNHSITDPGHNHDYTKRSGTTSVENEQSQISVNRNTATDQTSLKVTGITINNVAAQSAIEPVSLLQPYIVCYMWKRTA